jgi:uncharacterized protein YlxW (UPF0749 family)
MSDQKSGQSATVDDLRSRDARLIEEKQQTERNIRRLESEIKHIESQTKAKS